MRARPIQFANCEKSERDMDVSFVFIPKTVCPSTLSEVFTFM